VSSGEMLKRSPTKLGRLKVVPIPVIPAIFPLSMWRDVYGRACLDLPLETLLDLEGPRLR
jgi:hypothetical protein